MEHPKGGILHGREVKSDAPPPVSVEGSVARVLAPLLGVQENVVDRVPLRG